MSNDYKIISKNEVTLSLYNRIYKKEKNTTKIYGVHSSTTTGARYTILHKKGPDKKPYYILL